jgi:hypothetical protein
MSGGKRLVVDLAIKSLLIAAVLLMAGAFSPGAQAAPDSFSPDKKWKYVGSGKPKLVKSGTNETASLEFPEECDKGGCENSAPVWAPDSKRFGFNYGSGRSHNSMLYQLSGDEWEALDSTDDDAMQRADDIVAAQLKKKGWSKQKFLKKGMFLRLINSAVEVRQWLDAKTAIVHVIVQQVAARRDEPGEISDNFGAELLLTLKFDDAGKWKIVKMHEMTGKAAETPSLATPLSDKILYESPQGSYRIQASADGTSLWIVPAKDPKQRKPLPGADPDDRSPEEFSASPDERWLFDKRGPELYHDAGNLAFAPFTGKQWLWKHALDYASKEFHFGRQEGGCGWARWSADSARLLINFEGSPPQQRFAYLNTRTKAFEQTAYLRMVNAKLNTERPYEAFPLGVFAHQHLSRYTVFAEPIDPPPSEEILKARFTALDQEMNTLREKNLADIATRAEKSIIELNRSENEKWKQMCDQAVQLYLPFALPAEQQSRKLQFLCDLTQQEVSGLKLNAE